MSVCRARLGLAAAWLYALILILVAGALGEPALLSQAATALLVVAWWRTWARHASTGAATRGEPGGRVPWPLLAAAAVALGFAREWSFDDPWTPPRLLLVTWLATLAMGRLWQRRRGAF